MVFMFMVFLRPKIGNITDLIDEHTDQGILVINQLLDLLEHLHHRLQIGTPGILALKEIFYLKRLSGRHQLCVQKSASGLITNNAFF